jgi:hypothetical protein
MPTSPFMLNCVNPFFVSSDTLLLKLITSNLHLTNKTQQNNMIMLNIDRFSKIIKTEMILNYSQKWTETSFLFSLNTVSCYIFYGHINIRKLIVKIVFLLSWDFDYEIYLKAFTLSLTLSFLRVFTFSHFEEKKRKYDMMALISRHRKHLLIKYTEQYYSKATTNMI